MSDNERLYRHESGGKVWYSKHYIDDGPAGDFVADLFDEHPVVGRYIFGTILAFLLGFFVCGLILWAFCDEQVKEEHYIFPIIVYVVTAFIGRFLIGRSIVTLGNYIWISICIVASYLFYIVVSDQPENFPSTLAIVFQSIWLFIVLVGHPYEQSNSKDNKSETK